MTESEALKLLKNNEERKTAGRYICVKHLSIMALEKQIPKKPINNKHTVRISDTAVKIADWWKCGKCNGDLTRQFVCCPYCQTVIDWSDTD